MVHSADGGAVGDGSGVGYKLNVEVNSLRVLADQIADDLADFDAEFENWNQQQHYSHPLSAQYAPKRGFTIFDEANQLDGANRGSHLQVEIGVELVRKGLEALHKAADNLAKTYRNLDEANAVDVARVQWLFPEPKPAGGGGGGRELPSPEQMQQAIHPDGFDLDGDGVVDPAKGDILFAPSTAKPAQFNGDTSKNDTPADVPLDAHGGYARPVDETMPTQESGGFSEEVREEYAEQLAEEPIIMAPGAPGTDAGAPSGTVTA